MKLTVKEKQLVWDTYDSSLANTREYHDKKLKAINGVNTHSLYASALQEYAHHSINLLIDAYISVYSKQRKYPDQESIDDIFKEVNTMAENYANQFERKYPPLILMPAVVLQIKEDMLRSLQQVCSRKMSSLYKLKTEGELESENTIYDNIENNVKIFFCLLNGKTCIDYMGLENFLKDTLNCEIIISKANDNLIVTANKIIKQTLLDILLQPDISTKLTQFKVGDIQEVIDDKQECIYQYIPQKQFREAKIIDIPVADMKDIASKIEILFLTVNKWEKQALLSEMKPLSGKEGLLRGKINQQIYRIGCFGNYTAAHVECSMGSQGRRGSTTTLKDSIHELENVKAVFLIGLAFGLDKKKQRLGDVLVADSIFPYTYQKIENPNPTYRGQEILCGDTLSHNFASLIEDWKEPLYGNKLVNVHQGKILSGDNLLNDFPTINLLKKDFPTALGGEMEAAGGYAAIRPPREIILIKSICDWGDGTKDDRAQPFAAYTAVSLAKHVLSKPDVLAPLITTTSLTRPLVNSSSTPQSFVNTTIMNTYKLSDLDNLSFVEFVEKHFSRIELSKVWFAIFNSKMDDYLNNKDFAECIIELRSRAEKQSKLPALFDSIIRIRPNIEENITINP